MSNLCVCLSFAIDSCGCVSAVFLPLWHGPTLLSHGSDLAWICMAAFHLNFSMVALHETTLSLVTFEFCDGGVIQRNLFWIVTMYVKSSTLVLGAKLFCSCTKACSYSCINQRAGLCLNFAVILLFIETCQMAGFHLNFSMVALCETRLSLRHLAFAAVCRETSCAWT